MHSLHKRNRTLRRRRRVEPDRSKPVAVLQRRLNTVDKLYGMSRPCGQDGGHPHALVTLRGPVPARLCVRPSPLHWIHTRINVIAVCPVRAALSRYKKPASRDITLFRVDEAYLH